MRLLYISLHKEWTVLTDLLACALKLKHLKMWIKNTWSSKRFHNSIILGLKANIKQEIFKTTHPQHSKFNQFKILQMQATEKHSCYHPEISSLNPDDSGTIRGQKPERAKVGCALRERGLMYSVSLSITSNIKPKPIIGTVSECSCNWNCADCALLPVAWTAIWKDAVGALEKEVLYVMAFALPGC